MPESPERCAVARYRMVLVVAALYTPEPVADLRQRFVHPAAEFLPKLRSFARIRLPDVLRQTMNRPFLNPQ